jgi:hypothetical protein
MGGAALAAFLREHASRQAEVECIAKGKFGVKVSVATSALAWRTALNSCKPDIVYTNIDQNNC